MSVPPNALPNVGDDRSDLHLGRSPECGGKSAGLAGVDVENSTSTGPVTVPEPFGFVSRAVGENLEAVELDARTWACAEPKKTCTGASNASPVTVSRVPPTGPRSGLARGSPASVQERCR